MQRMRAVPCSKGGTGRPATHLRRTRAEGHRCASPYLALPCSGPSLVAPPESCVRTDNTTAFRVWPPPGSGIRHRLFRSQKSQRHPLFRARARRGGSTVSLLRHGRLGCRGKIDCALGPKHGEIIKQRKVRVWQTEQTSMTSGRPSVARHVADVAVERRMMRP